MNLRTLYTIEQIIDKSCYTARELVTEFVESLAFCRKQEQILRCFISYPFPFYSLQYLQLSCLFEFSLHLFSHLASTIILFVSLSKVNIQVNYWINCCFPDKTTSPVSPFLSFLMPRFRMLLGQNFWTYFHNVLFQLETAIYEAKIKLLYYIVNFFSLWSMLHRY